MKILLISDLHGQDDALKYLDKFLSKEKVELVLAAGDITDKNEGAVRYLHSLLDIVVNEHEVEFLGLHGNNDHPDVLELLDQMGRSLHMRTIDVGDLKVSGIGGWADLSEQVLEDPSFTTEGTLFVTHVPPKKLEGAKYYNLPLAHISGHIHVSKPYKRMMGGVPHIQLGALKDGWLSALEYPSMRLSHKNMSEREVKK